MMISDGDRFFIVEERPNPSTDLYLLPKLFAHGIDPIKTSFDNLPTPKQITGASIILVRYISKKWKTFITQHRALIKDVILFMDDDLFDVAGSHSIPLRYRWKIVRLTASRQGWLRAMDAKLWLSTPHLLNKYADWQPEHVYPRAIARKREVIQVFYHGSASHQREIHWLYEIIKAVLLENPALSFEIIGGQNVYKLYRDLPRTTILHPMPWQTYKTLLCQPGRQIGLAPLMDIPFNHARSYTKFFDITQTGAVGIYAKDSQYAEVIEDHQNGILLDMDKDAWIEAILELAGMPEQREAMHQQALKTVADVVQHEV
ncbi:glycosyltransferase family 1 protein [Gynuella sp.]|uniref:glycosyltransferase family 1 protein n=1 Tax=Gynuella sp. TaxID=2969146 RepID=UPI003D1124A4